jgi:hypothetical protein
MKKWEKIFFWVLTAVIIIDNIQWQWLWKFQTGEGKPTWGQPLWLNLIADILILVVWFWLLLKIYKKAFPGHPQNNGK